MLIGALGYDKDDVLQVILIGQTLDVGLALYILLLSFKAETQRFSQF